MAIKHNYKRMRKLKFIIFILIVLGAGYLYADHKGYFTEMKGWFETSTTYTNTSATSTVTVDEGKDEKDRIRSREEIKRQQELIVEETYLNEERARVEKAKADAIAKYDAEIAELEAKLEAVRTERVSFQ